VTTYLLRPTPRHCKEHIPPGALAQGGSDVAIHLKTVLTKLVRFEQTDSMIAITINQSSLSANVAHKT
jgi:hypothetical protein